jgi:hypothetical protein
VAVAAGGARADKMPMAPPPPGQGAAADGPQAQILKSSLDRDVIG